MLWWISVKWLILIVILVAHLVFWRCAGNLFTLGNEGSLKFLYLYWILYYLTLYFWNSLLLLLWNILLSRHWSLASLWCSRNLWSGLQLGGQSLKVIFLGFFPKLTDFAILLLHWCIHLRVSLRILVINLTAAHKRLRMLHSSSLRRLDWRNRPDGRSSIWTLVRALSSNITLWVICILRFSVSILLIQLDYSFYLLITTLAFIK